MKLANIVQDWVEAKRHAREKEQAIKEEKEKSKKYIRTILDLEEDEKVYHQSEDNTARESKLHQFLDEFYYVDQVREAVNDISSTISTATHFQTAGPSDKIVKIAEHALSLNNIQLQIMVSTVGDSAIVIDPVKDKKFLRVPLSVLVPEISKIPFTLYKKLGIRILTICQAAHLMKPSFQQVFAKKRYLGLFSINADNTAEKMVKHFYRILCYYLVNYKNGFISDWKSLNMKEFQYGSPKRVKNLQGFLSNEAKSNIFADQCDILIRLIFDKDELLKNNDSIVVVKAKKMVDLMEVIDPEGIQPDFWKRCSDIQDNNPFKLNLFE